MTLLALFFWYHWNWIHQRRAAIESGDVDVVQYPGDIPPPAPGLLGLFGERGYQQVYALAPTEEPELETHRRLASLFPEAEIYIEIACPPDSFRSRTP
jgi:hypothetical protein